MLTGFSLAAWEILGCLCNGGTLVLRGSDWRQALKEVSSREIPKVDAVSLT